MKLQRVLMLLLAALLLPGLALAQTTTRATFAVTKNFIGDDTALVKVTLNCFTGLPITQYQWIAENSGVVFVVTDFDSGELDCTVTEADVNGYTTNYDTCGDAGSFTDVADGDAKNCHILNRPIPQQVAVTKDWVIDGSGGNALDPSYSLTLICDDNIYGGEYCDYPKLQGGNKSGIYVECEGASPGESYKVLTYTGTGNTNNATYTADVEPDWNGGTNCRVDETVNDSSVEVDNDCGNLNVTIGEGDECTITNTVFYEGIPTLSHYGMAMMALLMLGVGFVGFRRFV